MPISQPPTWQIWKLKEAAPDQVPSDSACHSEAALPGTTCHLPAVITVTSLPGRPFSGGTWWNLVKSPGNHAWRELLARSKRSKWAQAWLKLAVGVKNWITGWPTDWQSRFSIDKLIDHHVNSWGLLKNMRSSDFWLTMTWRLKIWPFQWKLQPRLGRPREWTRCYLSLRMSNASNMIPVLGLHWKGAVAPIPWWLCIACLVKGPINQSE